MCVCEIFTIPIGANYSPPHYLTIAIYLITNGIRLWNYSRDT